jgi:DNA repair exonuclease SbcCD nuclease subunit
MTNLNKPTNIYYISDLHLEHWQLLKKQTIVDKIISDVKEFEVDILVLAGDVDEGLEIQRTLLSFLRRLPVSIPLIYIPGNHEYYGSSGDFSKRLSLSRELKKDSTELRTFIKDHKFFMIEDCEVHLIHGIYFTGLMGWIDETYKQIHFRDRTPEFFLMRKSNSDFTHILNYQKTLERGKEDFAILKAKLKELQKQQDLLLHKGKKRKPVVVISHFIPCKELIPPLYMTSKINGCFYNDWIDTIKDLSIDHWIYGHTHTSTEEEIHGIKFHCNPLGYPFERNPLSVRMIQI